MRISIVTPVYNEQECVEACVERVRAVMSTWLPTYDYEHILCDDASTDATLGILIYLAGKFPDHVKAIFNERNAGAETNTLNGVLAATGDAILVSLLSDCQDPPEVIPHMVSVFNCGYKIVASKRMERAQIEGWFLAVLKSIYYWLLNRVAIGAYIVPNAGDFQLVDREVQKYLRNCVGIKPSLRVMIAQSEAWVGNRAITWHLFAPRMGGEAKGTGNWGRLFAHALNDFRVALRCPAKDGPVIEKERLNFD